MKIKVLVLIICMVSNAAMAQSSQHSIYKVFERLNEDCRRGVDRIVLYKDSSFNVSSCIGNIAVQYNGGWWINDTSLVLQPSLNCNAPQLLNKKEFRDKHKNDNEITVEVYNEKGILLYYGKINDTKQIETIQSKGCIISDVRESICFRYFHFIVKGKKLSPVKTRKKDNKIEIIILEPSTSSDVYFGKENIPLRHLTEIKGN